MSTNELRSRDAWVLIKRSIKEPTPLHRSDQNSDGLEYILGGSETSDLGLPKESLRPLKPRVIHHGLRDGQPSAEPSTLGGLVQSTGSIPYLDKSQLRQTEQPSIYYALESWLGKLVRPAQIVRLTDVHDRFALEGVYSPLGTPGQWVFR